MGGFPKHYCCESAMYLLLCISLLFSIVINKAVGVPGNVKYVVVGLNVRDKRMLKLAMENLLDTELI